VSRLRRGQLWVPGDGAGIMNHVYVDNLLDAIFLALDKLDKAGGHVFNVTDGAVTMQSRQCWF
jgi:nucleoside-diphosphate-sugar epimerase